MTNKFILGGVVLAVVLSVLAFVKVNSGVFGAIGTLPIEEYVPAIRYNDGYYSEKDITTNGDLVVSGRSFTLTTSNTSTSTASVGCIQTTATSTATPIRFLIHSTTTPSTISGVASGYVAWGYGSCPI